MPRVIVNLEVDRLRRRILLKRRKRGKGKLVIARDDQRGARRNGRVSRWGGAVIGGEAAGEGMFTEPTAFEISLDHDGALVCHH